MDFVHPKATADKNGQHARREGSPWRTTAAAEPKRDTTAKAKNFITSITRFEPKCTCVTDVHNTCSFLSKSSQAFWRGLEPKTTN